MSSEQYEGRVPPEAVALVARLHATLDALHNLVLLCRHHHRTLHTGYWHLTRAEHDHGPPGQRVHDWVAVHPDGHTTPLQTATDRSPPLTPAARDQAESDNAAW